jgi:hypothetical protein
MTAVGFQVRSQSLVSHGPGARRPGSTRRGGWVVERVVSHFRGGPARPPHSDLNLARQTEFAKKVFDIALLDAQETAQLTRMSTGDAVKILQDRMRKSLEEIRGQGGDRR